MPVAAPRIPKYRVPGKIRYKIMPGARLDKKKAERYGKHLAKMARTGELTPERVYEEARRPGSPLHDFFEWNDKKAAREYRIEQARYLLRSIGIEIIGPKGEVMETRAFHNVVVPLFENGEEHQIRVYKPSETVFSERDLKSQVVQQALDELVGWQDRYGRYKELNSASFLVRRAIKTLSTRGKKSP